MNLKNNTEINLLIPDGECHLTMYVINCLAEVKQLNIFLLSKSKNNPLRYSRYVKKFIYRPTENDDDWITEINRLCTDLNIDLILPIFETAFEALLIKKHQLVQDNLLPLLPEASNFRTAVNKWQLYEHCKKHAIAVPKSIRIAPDQSIHLEELNFPLIAKPVEGYGGGMGLMTFDNASEFASKFDGLQRNCTYIVQEYIKGYDIDCSVLCKQGEVLVYTIQKGNMKGKTEFAPQLGYEFIQDEQVLKCVKKLMKSLNWSGIAHIDGRYDQDSRVFHLIEINARFWVSLEASHLVGINFPWLYIKASLGENPTNIHYLTTAVLGLKGLVKNLQRRPTLLLQPRFIWNNSPLKFALNDPLPVVVKFVTRTRNILNKIRS